MAIKRPVYPCGKVITLAHQSRVLRGNRLGDPTDRNIQVYLPAQYDLSTKRRYPVLFDLVGYTGAGPAHTNWRNFEENVPEKLDRLIASKTMPACIVVFPDCFTALGGNQYINSSAVGKYADYLTRELVPYIDQKLRTKAHRDHRGCFGKSSGGYGAIVHGMLYPDVWGAVANHSGDAYFDFVYRSEWPGVLTHLAAFAPGPRTIKAKASHRARGQDDGRIKAFLDYVWGTERLGGSDIMALMMVCMAATYDPDRSAPNGFRVPYDLHTGEFLQNRWRRWLAHDPLTLVKSHTAALKSLRGIFIDVGQQDQYHIHYGARQLNQALNKAQVKHQYEEFQGTHSGIDDRMDISLPFLARRLR